MARIYVGTCSWAEKSLIGTFYPENIRPSDMISYYSAHFPVVEVDSTFYHMPSYRNAMLWAERTPPEFKFDYKAFGPMTTHSGEYNGEKLRRATEDMLHEFEDAVSPLAAEGRLGYILFQLPKWFFPSDKNKDYIAWCAEHMPNSLIAVEFRNGYWFKDDERTRETSDFLSGIGAVYVNVDEPQVDIKSSVPPIDLVTARDMSVFRLHGRKKETWDLRGATVEERFDYDYSSEELSDEIAPRVQHVASQPVQEIHVMFNNVHHGYGPSDASKLIEILKQLEMPLVEPQSASQPLGSQRSLAF
ncbi:MAG: DUF72 domain-containing protein [Armatimonadetes bacterium]|nr:DUF72 domain-containing protein [Armatimonadota bacterium]